MVQKVYVYNDTGEYLGYARLGTDDIGSPVAEIYNTEADRLGAIQYRALDLAPLEGLVYNQDGDQIGFVIVETGPEGRAEAEIYRLDIVGDDQEHLAHVHLSGGHEQAQVYVNPPWGEQVATLKPENVSDEELVVAGGGAAMLLLLR
jgi:hypothetical protein